MPGLTIPESSTRFRLLLISYGLVILIWLTPEGNDVRLVSLLGWGLAYLMVALAIMERFGGAHYPARRWIPAAIGAGLVNGFSAALLTVLLMLMKNVQHSHLALDFPADVVWGILRRGPVWAVAAIFVNLAGVLLYISWQGGTSEIRNDTKTQ